MDSKYNRIAEILRTFEKSIDDKHEIGLLFPLAFEAAPLAVTRGCGEDFILFELVGKNGETFTVVQNYSQINFAIVALPTKTQPRRLGFRPDNHHEEASTSEM